MERQQIIKIILKAYDHRVLDQSVRDIVETARRTGAKVKGPIPLPTKNSVYVVVRSPHIDKRSGERFAMRTYKRLVGISDYSASTIDHLKKLELPSGVGIEIKA